MKSDELSELASFSFHSIQYHSIPLPIHPQTLSYPCTLPTMHRRSLLLPPTW